jgi:hypothetical protein
MTRSRSLRARASSACSAHGIVGGKVASRIAAARAHGARRRQAIGSKPALSAQPRAPTSPHGQPVESHAHRPAAIERPAHRQRAAAHAPIVVPTEKAFSPQGMLRKRRAPVGGLGT